MKRILITKHLSSIFNLIPLDKETTSGSSKLADDMQQHLTSLRTLGVSVNPETTVYTLETKLPKRTLEKWKATFERDELPKPD